MTAVVLTQQDKDVIKSIHSTCAGVKDTCELKLRNYAFSRNRTTHFPSKDELIEELKKYFCNEYPGVDFCPAPSTMPPPAPQVVQGPPPLTPEQIQQQQQYEQFQRQQQEMMKILSEYTTPSGFIGQNPGITIGLAVVLISGFCCFAALALSFLTSKNQKPPVPPNRGRRGNQIRKPSKTRNHQRKEKTISSMEKGTSKMKPIEKEAVKENEEKPKSGYSKSKKNSKESVDSTS